MSKPSCCCSYQGRHILTTTILIASRILPLVRSFTPTKRLDARPFSFSRSAGAPPSKSSSTLKTPLSWETFEFSSSPKWDSRFEDKDSLRHFDMVSVTDEEYQELVEQEAQKDTETAHRINQQSAAWQRLDPVLVRRGIEVLRPYVLPERMERIQSVLNQRTKHTRFLFENPVNPSNVWACLRTMDSFGIQYVDVIIQSGVYKGKAALSQKRGMRTAMGSAQWLTLTNYGSTTEALRVLKQELNCRIYASDVNANSKDIRDIDWSGGDLDGSTSSSGGDDLDDNRPICIVMGNEKSGISDELREHADATFTLPMTGFAESFNLSVATAITCAHLSAASSKIQGKGPLRPGDLSPAELDCLLLKGLYNSVAKKKVAHTLLKREGVHLPEDIRMG